MKAPQSELLTAADGGRDAHDRQAERTPADVLAEALGLRLPLPVGEVRLPLAGLDALNLDRAGPFGPPLSLPVPAGEARVRIIRSPGLDLVQGGSFGPPPTLA